MNLSIWKDKNKNILYSIKNYRYEVGKPKVLPTLLDFFVVNNGHDNLYGDLGTHLQIFLKSVDLNHPELDHFLTKMFGHEGLEEIEIIHDIAAFCVRKKYDPIICRLKNLFKIFTKSNMPHHGKTLGNPLETHAYTRFLPKEKLWFARESKKPQSIQSRNNNFESIIFDTSILDAYYHNSDKSLQLKSELERKKSIFDSMNCVHLSGEIDAAIKKIDDDFIYCNFGFRRITLTAAANCLINILGKSVDVYLEPVKHEKLSENKVLSDFIESCDNFSCFNNVKSVFDHYGIIKAYDENLGLLVGERDLKTFFIGFYYHE